MQVCEELIPLAGMRPKCGWQQAWDAVRRADRARCPRAQVIARRALALATRELGDLAGADEHLRRAIALATPVLARSPGSACTADLAHLTAQARLSLVAIRAERGHPAEALRLADEAEPYLSPGERGKLGANRAVALVRLGRCAEAVEVCDGALAVLDAAEPADVVFVAGTLLNRGLARAFLGLYEQAERDVARCAKLAANAGLGHLLRLAQANLPFLAVCRGRIGAAFHACREAERTLAEFPERLAAMQADLAEALLASGLPHEARVLLEQAVPSLKSADAGVTLTDTRLLLARAELLTGDPARAAATASQVGAELTFQDRPHYAPLAHEVRVRARAAVELPSRPLLDDVTRCAADLTAAGRAAEGADLALLAAGIATALGDRATARSLIPPTARTPQAVAMRHALHGDLTAAFTTLTEALAAERRHVSHPAGSIGWPADVSQSFPPATGIEPAGPGTVHPAEAARARAAAVRLARYGVELAIESGRAEAVLCWSEAVRAPEKDPLCLERLRADLGDVALVSFVRHRREMAAVTLTPRRIGLHHLGAQETIAEATVRLRYAMRRAAQRDPVGSRWANREADEVYQRLFAPLAADIAGRELLVVPTGTLHTLPWAALPPLREVPVSIGTETRAGRRAWDSGAAPKVAAVAGPGLDHGRAEVSAVLACHGQATEVPPLRAAVVKALEQAEIVHVAAHGRFCPRAPLLSGVELADGTLMAYDLVGPRTSPRLVALSACDSGMAQTQADGVRSGLVGTLLARGTGCVIAGLLPVRDEETMHLMSAFHTLLAAGRTPAQALAAAAASTGQWSFACFGDGHHPVIAGSAVPPQP
ncbi:CHAT domain-containing protein [Sinosporangium siamense]|uniref:CHAT domain-containing protein n=1 Tax=Sinosporangium siamense TaxID=1367973 RepID=A0A919RE74_9ACTN|nr:CHAT domain-containing protein [Sinosporangium siamense]